uniref:Uncharacterized protein n=1 Tax=Anguilla anguilla TaxID=7936 RepID=A0A0E9WI40_ANGAN
MITFVMRDLVNCRLSSLNRTLQPKIQLAFMPLLTRKACQLAQNYRLALMLRKVKARPLKNFLM